MKQTLIRIVLIGASLVVFAGCDRIPWGYAGDREFKGAPQYTVDPALNVPTKTK